MGAIRQFKEKVLSRPSQFLSETLSKSSINHELVEDSRKVVEKAAMEWRKRRNIKSMMKETMDIQKAGGCMLHAQ